jgi:hypothetical protein
VESHGFLSYLVNAIWKAMIRFSATRESRCATISFVGCGAFGATFVAAFPEVYNLGVEKRITFQLSGVAAVESITEGGCAYRTNRTGAIYY